MQGFGFIIYAQLKSNRVASTLQCPYCSTVLRITRNDHTDRALDPQEKL